MIKAETELSREKIVVKIVEIKIIKAKSLLHRYVLRRILVVMFSVPNTEEFICKNKT